MAEITLQLRRNPATGRRELVVHLETEDDLLPHEHERDHRRWVESLLGVPLDGDTDVVIDRVAPRPAGTTPEPTETTHAAREAERERT